MFFGMAPLLRLLLLVGVAVAAPTNSSSDSQPTTEHHHNTFSLDIDTTTHGGPQKTDEDSISHAALAQALGKGDFYDQRQDGDMNVHVRVDNATLYFVIFDVLGELAWRKGDKGSVQTYLSKKIPGLKRVSATERSSHTDTHGAATRPDFVSASPPAAVSASTPFPLEATSPPSKPQKSTYKPPAHEKPEPSVSTVIEIVTSEMPVVSSTENENRVQTTSKKEIISSAEKNSPEIDRRSGSNLLSATAKSQARSEEQISILNLLKRTAALTAHTANSSFRKHQNSGHQTGRR